MPLDNIYDISENDLQIFAKKYYSFTINLSTKKYIGGKQWKDIDELKQKLIINNVLKDAKKKLNLPDYEYYFELTKQKMVHLHGCIYTNHVGMLMLQQEIHNDLGLPKVHPNIVFYFEETKEDISHWRNYMYKTDPEKIRDSPEPLDEIDFID